MENLKERISREYLEAFKSRDSIKKNLLGVVKSEITTQEKNTVVENLADADVIKILNKFSKNLKETIEKSNSEEAKSELSILENYLPKQMSESEIKSALKEIIDELGNSSSSLPFQIGKLMGAFNSKYSGKADNKLVSNIIKELITTNV
jgi:hypothetical protein